MFKVLLHKCSGEVSEYTTPSLQYAKRYADLYKNDYPFVEIMQWENGKETVFETFGSRQTDNAKGRSI